MPSSCKKQTGGGKIWLPCGGTSIFALNFTCSNSPVILRWNCPPLMVLKFVGRDKNPTTTFAFLLVWVENTMGDRHYGLSIIWVEPSQIRAASMEEVVGKLTICTSSWTDWPYTLVLLHESTWPHATPQGGALGYPTSERGGGGPLWADQPTWGLSTPCCWPPSCLPCRFEWAWWAFYNLPTRVAGQQHKPYCWWTQLLGDWYPITSSGGARPKYTTSWWGLHHHSSQSP